MAHRATPQDPDFAARVRASFAQQGLMSTIGASLELVEPGEVHIALPFSPALSQQHGYMHAGATTAIADSANGYAALTLTPPGYEVLVAAGVAWACGLIAVIGVWFYGIQLWHGSAVAGGIATSMATRSLPPPMAEGPDPRPARGIPHPTGGLVGGCGHPEDIGRSVRERERGPTLGGSSKFWSHEPSSLGILLVPALRPPFAPVRCLRSPPPNKRLKLAARVGY